MTTDDEAALRIAYESARHVGIPSEQIDRWLGTMRMCGFVVERQRERAEPIGMFKHGISSREWYESSDDDAIPLYRAPAPEPDAQAKLEAERKAREEAEKHERKLAHRLNNCDELLKTEIERSTAAESALAKVFEDTRERCAKVCDAEKERANWPDSIIGGTAEKLAVQIRALSANGTAAPQECIGYPKCDGDLVAEPHSPECNAAALQSETPFPLSAHDHGNCELCDQLERDLARLRTACLAIANEMERTGRQGDADRLREIVGNG